ncbi:MAG TPA: hypothetical protein RMF84_15200 [Polyangiaceae bacterium LLY-WYZ-14_1]|nr:hypothetical protein [Polyangiaceae bacterium LLY-WYZ-14_1]
MRDDPVVHPALLDILADPETKGPVALCDDAALDALRRRVADGSARRGDGEPVPAFEAAFLAQEGRVAYLVVDGLPRFLLEERLELDPPLDT